MNYKFNAVKAISRRRLFDVLISPGFYIVAATGIFIGYELVSEFVDSVSSGGFNFQLNPMYKHIVEIITGLFGSTFVNKLFSEGPFLFSFFVSFIPVPGYLVICSVYRMGFEKSTGTLELFLYGPSDEACFFASFLVKDLILVFLYILTLAGFFTLSAKAFNLAIGDLFFYSLVLAFFVTWVILAYGILASALTNSTVSGLTLFISLMVLFTFLQVGTFTMRGEYVREFSTFFHGVLKWISPLYYWSLGMSSAYWGNKTIFFLSLLSLFFLGLAFFLASNKIQRLRGPK